MTTQPDDGQVRLDELTTALHAELHRIASWHLRGERRDHTLQTTALLNEAYLKLSDGSDPRFSDRTHFLAVASRVMRQVLVDHARARAAVKRSGGRSGGEQIQVAVRSHGSALDVLRVHQALESIAREDEALAHLAELRYFGGMSSTEIAGVVNRSIHAVRHDLRYVQAWLRRELSR
jgi:RNA polymerase sigma factor (TIGR02999 family)